MQLVAGMCAAKALEQLLCGRLNDSDNVHVFINIVLINIYAQILHSRAFAVYVPAIIFSLMHLSG